LEAQCLAARVFRPVRVALCFLHGRKHLPSVADFMRGKTGIQPIEIDRFIRELTCLIKFCLLAQKIRKVVQQEPFFL
jgi:hypothetical protein